MTTTDECNDHGIMLTSDAKLPDFIDTIVIESAGELKVSERC